MLQHMPWKFDEFHQSCSGKGEIGTSLYITRQSRKLKYRKTSNISRTFVGNNIVDNPDVVGASPVGAAPTTSSFST